jgi:hypothetical protein
MSSKNLWAKLREAFAANDAARRATPETPPAPVETAQDLLLMRGR